MERTIKINLIKQVFLTMTHIKRLNQDISRVMKNPMDSEGIYFWWDDKKLTEIYLMLVSPTKTPDELDNPYGAGYLLIKLEFSKDYPFQPPKGTFMTRDHRKETRLHPNLYASGKICLSTLGTWKQSTWQPTMNLAGIARTLMSILTPNPIVNEPSFERTKPESVNGKTYTQIVEYEIIRVAVLDQLDYLYRENPGIYIHFADMMKRSFLDNYDYFQSQVRKLRDQKLNGVEKDSPYCGIKTTFQLDQLESQLIEMRTKISAELNPIKPDLPIESPDLLADLLTAESEKPSADPMVLKSDLPKKSKKKRKPK